MYKLAVFVGTRPEAIKLAPVIIALRDRLPQAAVDIISTGQQPSEVIRYLLDFNLTPTSGLNPMGDAHRLISPAPSGALAIGTLTTCLDLAIRDSGYQLAIVQGDTSSALAAAMVAFHRGIPLVHVEAGLRTYDLNNPRPEEANRQLIARLADLHCCPTTEDANNLRREHVHGAVKVTGNSIASALDFAIKQTTVCIPDLGPHYVLVTIHRRETLDDQPALEQIGRAIRQLVAAFPSTAFAVVEHPRQANAIKLANAIGLETRDNFRYLSQLQYVDFIHLVAGAQLVLTDSGGLQEEAPALGTPALVARRTTERQPSALHGFSAVCGLNAEMIIAAATRELIGGAMRRRIADCAPLARNMYGLPESADNIARLCVKMLPGAQEEAPTDTTPAEA